MKKLITICLLFLSLNTLSFGQTKEETISWLKEKFSKYLQGDYRGSGKNILTEITINTCEINIKADHPSGKIIFVIPTEGLEIIPGGFLKNKSKKILKDYYEDKEKFLLDTFDDFHFLDAETDLYKRIESAIAHLATFCPPPKKETF